MVTMTALIEATNEIVILLVQVTFYILTSRLSGAAKLARKDRGQINLPLRPARNRAERARKEPMATETIEKPIGLASSYVQGGSK